MVSYYSAAGNYVKSDGYMSVPTYQWITHSSGNGSPDGPNGMYRYSAGFPNLNCTTCNGVNYWADVVMSSINHSQVMPLSSITDANGCTRRFLSVTDSQRLQSASS